MHEHSNVSAGVRAGLPLVLPTLALGVSFGVLARPVMGPVAPIAMSIFVFSGAAQFAALSVLAAGGGAVAAITAGMLMNARWLPMGFAIGPSLRGGPLARAAQGQTIVDASFVIANRGDGSFDRGLLMGATAAQAVAWVSGTVIGVLAGPVLGDPGSLGLDAIFVAFYLALLFEEARSRRAIVAGLAGAAIAFALMPFTPPGVPIIAASLAALVGLRAAHDDAPGSSSPSSSWARRPCGRPGRSRSAGAACPAAGRPSSASSRRRSSARSSSTRRSARAAAASSSTPASSASPPPRSRSPCACP